MFVGNRQSVYILASHWSQRVTDRQWTLWPWGRYRKVAYLNLRNAKLDSSEISVVQCSELCSLNLTLKIIA